MYETNLQIHPIHKIVLWAEKYTYIFILNIAFIYAIWDNSS